LNVGALQEDLLSLANILSNLRVGQFFPAIPARSMRLTLRVRQGAAGHAREIDQIDMLVPRADIFK